MKTMEKVANGQVTDALPSITLRRVDEVHARAILDRVPYANDRWVAGYPAEGDVEAAGMALRSIRSIIDSPFACYEVIDVTGQTVGGAGFHGPPGPTGVVEIGYGIAPSVRNRGFAKAAIRELKEIAISNGANRIIARTDPENRPSQRALEKSGFVLDRHDAEFAHLSFQCIQDPLRRVGSA
jgi:RimJ/RimL family protein N-acetyltransferase